MELYAKGQLSYLILNCLLERDFYGLDIITEINSKSGGKVNLKKPSVYSNLTRMEKQGYVSSYLKTSELGPNRKYYSITDSGRAFYNEIDQYFTRNNIDVFSEFEDVDVKEQAPIDMNVTNASESLIDNFNNNDLDESLALNESNLSENKERDDLNENSDFFDFSSVDVEQEDADEMKIENQNEFVNQDLIAQEQNNAENEIEGSGELYGETLDDNEISPLENEEYAYPSEDTIITEREDENQDDKIVAVANESSYVEQSDNKQNNYAFSIKNALLNADKVEENKDEESVEKNKDDAVFLNKQEVADYNQRLYDISKDINSYKKKKSFAEDQISIAAEAPLLSSSTEKRKANLEEFKNSLMQNRTSYNQSQDSFARFTNYKDKLESEKNNSSNVSITESGENKLKETEEPKIDDGKFIVAHVDASSIEKPRKIEPPRLKILPDNGKEKLPAPKRDSSIDPSHQEILSKLYAKTKGSLSEEQREDCLYDYNDLKDFYKNQNISFDVYEKPSTKTSHNTNKLYFIASLITFICACLGSTITYISLLKSTMLNTTFNFLYIVLPALLIVDVSIQTYNMIKYKSWLPKQILPQWQIWTITGALICLCIGLNFAFGMAVNEFSLYATTLILPIVFILAVIPARYYIKRSLLIRKWK